MKTTRTFICLIICLLGTNFTPALANENSLTDDHKPRLKKRKYYKDINRANVYSYKHIMKFSVSFSNTNRFTKNLFEEYKTSLNEDVTLPRITPIYSLGHEFFVEDIFSLSYNFTYASNNIKIRDEDLQTYQVGFFVKPKLSLFRTSWFEAYSQLNIGVVYNDMNFDLIEDEILERRLPGNFKMYTGFTPFGMNFKLADNLWFNTEASLWSFESISCGLKLKMGKNMEHPKYWVGI